MKLKKDRSIMEEVKRDYEIKSKRMDPFLKARIKSLVFIVAFFLFVYFIIVLMPREEYLKNDRRISSYMSYSEIIENIHDVGFKYDVHNNPEGYILVDNDITYLIKIFYKENYDTADLTIYAYTSYYNRQGIVINRKNDEYKVHFYINNEDVYTDIFGNTEKPTKNYLDNKDQIVNIINKIKELNKKIFTVEVEV